MSACPLKRRLWRAQDTPAYDRIWRDCLLGYCGFVRVERQVYRVVAWSDEAIREEWLRDAAARATALAMVDVQGEPHIEEIADAG